MRLEAQKKMGFYPAPEDAIAALLKHLVPGASTGIHIIDPCAGQGRAIKQIGEGLGIPKEQVYAVELDPGRGQIARSESPGMNVLSPCSFFSTSITAQSFGLVYANPPYDDELGGGGREELAFLYACYRLLCTSGVFAFVAPWRTMHDSRTITALDQHYRDGRLYRFPKMQYNELVFIGLKRAMPIVGERVTSEGSLAAKMKFGTYWSKVREPENVDCLGMPGRHWHDASHVSSDVRPAKFWIPDTWKPARFLKAGYTDEELLAAINASPLNKLAMGTTEPSMKQPPLPLARGHVAMLLASGALDGLVETPIGNHVVRGVSSKVEVYNEEASETTMSDDGKSMKVKDVYSEKICLKVRAVDSTGTIYTYTNEGAAKADSDSLKEEDYTYNEMQLLRRLDARLDPKNNCTYAEQEQAKRQIDKIKADASRRKQGARKTGT